MTTKQATWYYAGVCLALALIVLLIPGRTEACSCARSASDSDIAVRVVFQSADVVFRGSVKSVIPKTMPGSRHESGSSYLAGSSGDIALFDVEKVWKGDPGLAELELFTNVTMCDLWFEPGNEAVLMVYKDEDFGVYTTNICIMSFYDISSDEELVRVLDGISAEEVADWQSDYITYGCGGGIAASYSDTTIYRDGRRTRHSYSFRGEKSSEKVELDPDPELAESVFNRIDFNELDRIDGMDQWATYKCRMVARVFGREYSATWSGGDERPSEYFVKNLKRIRSTDP